MTLSAGISALLLVAPAFAQVIEIDAQGVATTYDGPTVFLGDFTSPAPLAPSSFPHANAYEAVAKAHGLPARLLAAVAWQESRGRQTAVSPKGAIGIMQLMPETARQIGVDPFDPVQNLEGGATYLRRQLDRFGSLPLALAAYNAGPGAVMRYGGIPPYRETQTYVSRILGRIGNEADSSARPAPPVSNNLLIEVSNP